MKNPLLSIVTISSVLPIYKLNRDENNQQFNSQMPATNIVMYKFAENEYEVIGQKYLYSIGEKVILIHPDSNLIGDNAELVFESYIMPDGDKKKCKLGKNNRVRAISFNFAKTNSLSDVSKIYSNGILIPSTLLMDLKLSDSILPDMTDNMWNELLPTLPELLGVTKIESETDNSTGTKNQNKKGDFPQFLIKSDETNFKNARRSDINLMMKDEIVATFKTDGSSIKLFYMQHPNRKINEAFINVFRKNNCIPFNVEEEMEIELGYEPIYDTGDVMYKQLDNKHTDRITNYFGICSRNFQLQMFGTNLKHFKSNYNVITKTVEEKEVHDKSHPYYGSCFFYTGLSTDTNFDYNSQTLIIKANLMQLIDNYINDEANQFYTFDSLKQYLLNTIAEQDKCKITIEQVEKLFADIALYNLDKSIFDKEFTLSNNEWVSTGFPYLNKLIDYCINTNQSIALGGELCGQGMAGSGNKYNPHSSKTRDIEFYQADIINTNVVPIRSEVLPMVKFFEIMTILNFKTVEIMFQQQFELVDDLHNKCKEVFDKRVFEGLVLRNINNPQYSFKYMNEEYDSKK